MRVLVAPPGGALWTIMSQKQGVQSSAVVKLAVEWGEGGLVLL